MAGQMMNEVDLVNMLLAQGKIYINDLSGDENQMLMQMALQGDVKSERDEYGNNYWYIPEGSGLQDYNV